MIQYDVCLEVDDHGHCMARVLALPGCTVRANSREACIEALRGAIASHHAWLRVHGEPAPAAQAPTSLTVVEEVAGTGPFDPGDAAALFAADREPLTRDEMEAHFRLMGHARADLLALVAHLPDDVLDWDPGAGAFSIRRIARHVGNAEQWYVSRLAPASTLPREWDDDEAMPLLAFLEMERRTGVERLWQLSDEELAAVLHPTAWTRHPGEAWTARKVVRRFLEHELEHTRQVREVLGLRRAALRAELDAARETLLSAARRVVGAGCASRPICGDWNLYDVLAHVVAWEMFGVDGLRDMAAGRPPGVEWIVDIDAWNAEQVRARRGQSWDELWGALVEARRDLRSALEMMEPADLWHSFPFPWGGEGTPYDWLAIYARHDLEHAEQIAAGAIERG